MTVKYHIIKKWCCNSSRMGYCTGRKMVFVNEKEFFQKTVRYNSSLGKFKQLGEELRRYYRQPDNYWFAIITFIPVLIIWLKWLWKKIAP